MSRLKKEPKKTIAGIHIVISYIVCNIYSQEGSGSGLVNNYEVHWWLKPKNNRFIGKKHIHISLYINSNQSNNMNHTKLCTICGMFGSTKWRSEQSRFSNKIKKHTENRVIHNTIIDSKTQSNNQTVLLSQQLPANVTTSTQAVLIIIVFCLF